jgi:ABC-2 type transport system ATP-binding protein
VRDLVVTKKISVLWITHLFDEVTFEDDLSIIKAGEIIESGTVKEIVAKYEKDNLVDTFNFLVR